MRDVDFDEGFDFRTPTKPSPLQRLRDERRARRSPNCFTPRPAELFTEASGFADLDLEAGDALSGARSGVCDDANTLEEPNEDAFVASQALVRQREYELLEAWLQKGGAPEPFAPWFREMLMDQDDAACCSAVRAVTAHYRRVAKQQMQGEAAKAAPLAWLPGLLENLTERNLPQAAELAAAVLAVPALRGATSRDHEFFQHLVGPGAARLLAACQEQRVLQAEDLHEMAKVVQKTVRLPLEETEALSPAPGPKRPCPLQLLSGCEPKTWRQRLQCLDQIRGPDADGVHGPLLWSQLVLQAEDDHPAVSAAALQCLARLAHEMPPSGDHLLQRLGVALRHRVKEPRGKAACAQLLVAMAKTKWPQPLKLLLTNGLRLPKDLARQAVADLERHRPHEGELPILEALLAKRDARPMGTPSPRKIWASPKRTPSTATPSPASFASPLAARRCEDLPSASARTLAFASPKVPTARKAFVEIENRGSWQLPWDSRLLSFERKVREDRGERLRIPEVNEAVLTAALERLEEEEPKAVAEDLCSLALEGNLDRAGAIDFCLLNLQQGGVAELLRHLTEAWLVDLPELPKLETGRVSTPETPQHALEAEARCGNSQIRAVPEANPEALELGACFQKLHRITLDLSRLDGTEVLAPLRAAQALLARASLQSPLRRYLRRLLQRQRARAAAKENFSPGAPAHRPANFVLDDYASARELCNDEGLAGAFPHSLLYQLRLLLSESLPCVQKAAAEVLAACAVACGPLLRSALSSFSLMLLRLAANETDAPHATRCCARKALRELLSSWQGLRMSWRAWKAALPSGRLATDQAQALAAECLALLSELPHNTPPKQAVEEILALAVPCCSSQARATKEAAVVALQSLQTRLREDGKELPPEALAALELRKGDCPGSTAKGGALPAPEAQAAFGKAKERRAAPFLESQLGGGGSPVRTESRGSRTETPVSDGEAIAGRDASSAPGTQNLDTEATDLPSEDQLDVRPDWLQQAADLREKALEAPVAAVATLVLRLCSSAETADEAAAEQSLKSARETLGLLRQADLQSDTEILFRCMLQSLVCLQSLSRSPSAAVRRSTGPMLLEVPPFLAGAMDTIELDRQLLAWLPLASEFGLYSSSAEPARAWALRFCRRALEHCLNRLRPGQPFRTWEVLSAVVAFEYPEGEEWKLMLQALTAKITECCPAEAHEFAILAKAAGTPLPEAQDASRLDG